MSYKRPVRAWTHKSGEPTQNAGYSTVVPIVVHTDNHTSSRLPRESTSSHGPVVLERIGHRGNVISRHWEKCAHNMSICDEWNAGR